MSDDEISKGKPDLVPIEEEKLKDPARALKVELRGLLTSCPDPLTATALARAYEREFDSTVNVKRFGCSSLEQFLRESPDAFYIHTTADTTPRWCAVISKATARLRCLVLSQKRKGERDANRELLQPVARTGRGHQAAFRFNREDLDSDSLLPREAPKTAENINPGSNVMWKPRSEDVKEATTITVPQTEVSSINVDRAKRFGVMLSKLGLKTKSSLSAPPEENRKRSGEFDLAEDPEPTQNRGECKNAESISSVLSASSSLGKLLENPFRTPIDVPSTSEEEVRVFSYMYPGLKAARYLIEQDDRAKAKPLLARLFEDFVQYYGDDKSREKDLDFGLDILWQIHAAHFK